MQQFSILFDLGGVLIENNTFEELSKLTQKDNDLDLKQKWLKSPSVRQFELGKCAPEEFSRKFVSEWDLDIEPKFFTEEFASWPVGFMEGAESLISELQQKGHKIGCLSNSNEIHWERFGGFQQYFDVALSSHLLGKIKPDLDAFAAALKELSVEPEKVYFFDDSPACVEAAESMRINAFLANSPDDCRSILLGAGLYAT